MQDLWRKCTGHKMFHFSLQLLLETSFSLINIKQVMLKTCAEAYAALHVKYQIP
jgi:hypothetical protein